MTDTSSDRPIITSSSWWIWILLAVGVTVIIMIIYGGWRLFRGAAQAVKPETPTTVTAPKAKSEIRFVRTPTEVVVIDDPIIPKGETALESIVNNFTDYQGEKVTVSGTVTDFETASFFVVAQDENAIAVLSLPEAIKENELDGATNPETRYVKVTGTVKLLTKEREKTKFGLDYRDLDEAFWKDQMIIEAETIELVTPETI